MSAAAPPTPGSGVAGTPAEPPTAGADVGPGPTGAPLPDPAVAARRRRQRRTAITLVLTLALLVGVGLGGWLLVTGRWGAPEQAATPATCTPAGPAGQPAAVAPAGVRVRVLNGTGRAGIAGVTAAALRTRGFVVEGTGNAEPVRGALVRHGVGSAAAAALVVAHVDGATAVAEPRDDDVVDLVLGDGFVLRTPAQAAVALAAAPPAAPAGALPPC